jgi:2-amino-4-hydroxy-6-hydroxymethyldihydropteridine diphosphokinase
MTLKWCSRTRVFVGLGSNLDEPVKQIEAALHMLSEVPGTRVAARSSFYRSAPLGPVPQPDFVNAVAMLRTRRLPRELLEQMQAIERELGRQPGAHWGPRRIDLDLLIFGDETIDEDGLKVPHPGIAERNFVLLPLGEIAPDLFIPGIGQLADIAVNASEPRISRIA